MKTIVILTFVSSPRCFLLATHQLVEHFSGCRRLLEDLQSVTILVAAMLLYLVKIFTSNKNNLSVMFLFCFSNCNLTFL